MSLDQFLVPGGIAVASIPAVVTYFVARRKSSGNISNTDADKLFAAYNDLQQSTTTEFDKLRVFTTKLEADYAVERRGRMECEARITVLESHDAASVIIDTAKKEAATIRFDAAKAAEVLAVAAKKAASGLVDTAKQVEHEKGA